MKVLLLISLSVNLALSYFLLSEEYTSNKIDNLDNTSSILLHKPTHANNEKQAEQNAVILTHNCPEPSSPSTNSEDSFDFADILKSNTLTKTLIEKIRLGEIDPNTSIKASDPSYTPLVASLFLDSQLTPQEIQAYIAEGSNVQSTATWVVAASGLSRENLEVLLANNFDPAAKVHRLPLANLAFIAENYEIVNLLNERGYPVSSNYQIEREDRQGNIIVQEVNLREEIHKIQDTDKKSRLLNYLNSLN